MAHRKLYHRKHFGAGLLLALMGLALLALCLTRSFEGKRTVLAAPLCLAFSGLLAVMILSHLAAVLYYEHRL